jgi:hypothetical protein
MAEVGEKLPHRGLQELFLGPEIMMRQGRRYTGPPGDTPARPAISDMVTSSEPRSPIVRIAASMIALRRSFFIPIRGMAGFRRPHYFYLTGQSTKKPP